MARPPGQSLARIIMTHPLKVVMPAAQRILYHFFGIASIVPGIQARETEKWQRRSDAARHSNPNCKAWVKCTRPKSCPKCEYKFTNCQRPMPRLKPRPLLPLKRPRN